MGWANTFWAIRERSSMYRDRTIWCRAGRNRRSPICRRRSTTRTARLKKASRRIPTTWRTGLNASAIASSRMHPWRSDTNPRSLRICPTLHIARSGASRCKRRWRLRWMRISSGGSTPDVIRANTRHFASAFPRLLDRHPLGCYHTDKDAAENCSVHGTNSEAERGAGSALRRRFGCRNKKRTAGAVLTVWFLFLAVAQQLCARDAQQLFTRVHPAMGTDFTLYIYAA